MKNTILLIAASAAFVVPAFAQNGVLAHWDFKDGVGGSASLQPEDNGIDCITPKNVYPEGLTYSWSTKDSEDNSAYGANCFGSWSANDCVIFGVDFANNAVSQVNYVNFDVGNYGESSAINQVALRIWKNGTEITAPGQFVKNFASGTSSNPWTSSSDTTFNVSSLGIDSSAGSADNYKFAIFVTDTSYASNARIALDNFRLIGTSTCVPEPSSAALMGLAGLALLIRRKR
ncbi:MAG: PEP-CTERM sorting domain-containing protein [Akkermansiaceae bacterium]|nr:PEP-CTERM sorting domain-containing protein [Akkermansiaceae bacterium]